MTSSNRSPGRMLAALMLSATLLSACAGDQAPPREQVEAEQRAAANEKARIEAEARAAEQEKRMQEAEERARSSEQTNFQLSTVGLGLLFLAFFAGIIVGSRTRRNSKSRGEKSQ